MAYDIVLSLRDGYVLAEASGKRSMEDSANLARSFAKFADEHGVFNVLLILDLKGRLDEFQMYDLASRFEEYGLDSRFRLAIIDHNEETKPERDFMEDVVVNRGLNARVFDKEDDALAWLSG